MASPGTFYFAWVDSTETGFNGAHMREDELIFSFSLKHDEGQVAELEMEIVNPHVGLLAPWRPLWAWFSWNDGSAVHPLFFGRLIGIPDDLMAEVITVKFVAKPNNFPEQQLALSESLKVPPFYDPIFIDDKMLDDPNTVLEGYSALWHVDRVTHQVTISDIIAGEDGVVEFSSADVFYDQVGMKLAGAPLIVCEIEAEVQWVQTDHTGVIQFQTAPNLTGDTNIGNGLNVTGGSTTLGATLDALVPHFAVEATPEPQQVTEKWVWINPDPGPHEDGDKMEEGGEDSVPNYGGSETKRDEHETKGNSDTGQGYEYQISQTWEHVDHFLDIPGGDDSQQQPSTPSNTNQDMKIAVEMEQNRTERIHVRVLADVQPVLTQATEGADHIKESLTMNARDVVAAGAATPSDGVYFPTTRGLQSMEYLLMVARAHILAGSRVVEVSWECPFAKAIGLSCRQNATIEDSRLPGGVVLGKIVSYQMSGSGDDGKFVGGVTINSAVGNGNAVVVAAGVPDYVNAGYVDPGYQHYTGQLVAATTNDMVFEPLGYQATGLQLPITKDQILVRHEYIDTGRADAIAAVQIAAAQDSRSYGGLGSADEVVAQRVADASALAISRAAAINKAYNDHPVWVEIELKPVQQISTDVEYDAETSALSIPKQIDLASPSTP